jgi:hypothetical protein
VAQLRREVDRIHRHGAELVVVGNGTRHFARAFRDDVGLDTPIYVDTACASYRALHMNRGIARTLSWRTWASMFRALLNGLREERANVIARWWRLSVPVLVPGAQGDAWQLGGVLIAYSYQSAVAGDHPQTSDIMAALEASPAAAVTGPSHAEQALRRPHR